MPGRLKGMNLPGRRTTHAETWGGWVTAGGLICHSAKRITRSKTREGSRVPHEKNIVGQFWGAHTVCLKAIKGMLSLCLLRWIILMGGG